MFKEWYKIQNSKKTISVSDGENKFVTVDTENKNSKKNLITSWCIDVGLKL